MNTSYRVAFAVMAAMLCQAMPGVSHAGDNVSKTEARQSPFEQPVKVLDHRGKVHLFSSRSSEAARVFVFMTGECPISTSYVPKLKELAKSWSECEHKIRVYGVWADQTSKPADIQKFAQEYGIEFPILLDHLNVLGKSFQPTHVPEAFVLSSDGAVAYRGRIDDSYVDLGRRRAVAESRDLADAVDHVTKGIAVVPSRTTPIGCYYETLPAEAAKTTAVTYSKDVAPILFANCVICHRDGEIAPFSLVTYNDAAKRSRQISRVVQRKLMPPWLPSQTHGEFEEQRTLTDEQIQVLQAWADSGAAVGDEADLPALPTFVSGWKLGEPDLIVEMPAEFEIPADGADIYQNFVIPIEIPEDKLVAGVEFVPGNPRVVHHNLLYLDNRGQARALDEKSPDVMGYSTFGGPGFVPSGSIGGWSPGKTPRLLPEGYGRSMKKGSDLVMQNHYHPTGKVERDRSKIGIYFVKKPKRAAEAIWLSTHSHDIPPGDADYKQSASFTLPCDVTVFNVIPHMHLLGKHFHAEAVLPDGTRKELIDIQQWDFNWQDDYLYTQPMFLPKGTRLEASASYDNSENNPSNPSSPPQHVGWGEETNDEMLYCFLVVTTENPSDFGILIKSVLKAEVGSRAKARAASWWKGK